MSNKSDQKTFLPYGRQSIDQSDINSITKVLLSDYLTTGPQIELFEKEIMCITGSRFAVVVNSGTAALHLINLSMGIQPGDSVIVPAITFCATANAVRMCGGDVIFADVDEQSGLITPDLLDQVVTTAKKSGKNVRAAYCVHYAGQPADMPGLSEVAQYHQISLAEDACHALGSSLKHKDSMVRVGGGEFSCAAAFSFHPVKAITTGEGGAITTNDAAVAERVRKLRSHGISREEKDFRDGAFSDVMNGKANSWHYEMLELGFNYRISDFACALGLSQIKKLPSFIEKRQKLSNHYETLLKELSPYITTIKKTANCVPSWHLYVVLIDFDALGIERSEFTEKLKGKGIGSQVHYIPVPQLHYYRKLYNYDMNLYPGAEWFYERCLSLPLYPEMNVSDVEKVVDALRDILAKTNLN